MYRSPHGPFLSSGFGTASVGHLPWASSLTACTTGGFSPHEEANPPEPFGISGPKSRGPGGRGTPEMTCIPRSERLGGTGVRTLSCHGHDQWSQSSNVSALRRSGASPVGTEPFDAGVPFLRRAISGERIQTPEDAPRSHDDAGRPGKDLPIPERPEAGPPGPQMVAWPGPGSPSSA